MDFWIAVFACLVYCCLGADYPPDCSTGHHCKARRPSKVTSRFCERNIGVDACLKWHRYCKWHPYSASLSPNGNFLSPDDSDRFDFIQRSTWSAADKLETVSARPVHTEATDGQLYTVGQCGVVYSLALQPGAARIEAALAAPSLTARSPRITRVSAISRSDVVRKVKKGGMFSQGELNPPFSAISLLFWSKPGTTQMTQCSSTMITPRHVLTAAHCVVNHVKKRSGASEDYYFKDLNQFRLYPHMNKEFSLSLSERLGLPHDPEEQSKAKKRLRYQKMLASDKPYYRVKRVYVSSKYLTEATRTPHDWAVLELATKVDPKFVPLPFGYKEWNLPQSQMVTAGYPFNKPCCRLWSKPFHVDHVSDNYIEDQHPDATHSGGQSGSAVFDSQYTLLAIYTMSYTRGHRAVPITKRRYLIICDLLGEYIRICNGLQYGHLPPLPPDAAYINDDGDLIEDENVFLLHHDMILVYVLMMCCMVLIFAVCFVFGCGVSYVTVSCKDKEDEEEYSI